MKKPLILVTNDDGIDSKGIRFLVSLMSEFGEVVVVAPDSPQSGMGHAITVGDKLRLVKSDLFGDIESYKCSGTPADCVKLGINEILRRKPDICVSGINHGSNSSINVVYSGTMSAAIEASIEGVPSIGFSLLDYSWKANFEIFKDYVKKITIAALKNKIPSGNSLNVNFPKLSKKEIKGIKICRQAKAFWIEKFDKRINPQGKKYYWLTGDFIDDDNSPDTDEWALKNGYISIVPIKFDMTDHKNIKELEDWKF